MCPTKPYGSIGMSSRWSQKMFYQRKFKSLHHVKRSGKKKIWIPLERKSWVESKELEGESEEGPWEILLLPNLSLFFGWNFKTPLELREVKERRKRGGCSTVRQGECWWNDRGERRRGVKDGFFLLWPHGLKSGVTGQTGDRPWSSQRALISFSDPPSVEPKILIKFNREALSVEPTYPRLFRPFSSFWDFAP
jgi:hypothetical protein